MIRRVRFFDSKEQFIRESAEILKQRGHDGIKKRGAFHCAFSIEQSSSSLYNWLGENPSFLGRIWRKTHVWFADERFVSRESINSAFGILYDTLLKRVPVRERFIHPIDCNVSDVKTAAAEYQTEITETFHALRTGGFFDLVLLGLGPDGHTAGLFPGKYAKNAKDLVISVPKPGQEPHIPRITFSLDLFNQSRTILLVSRYQGKEAIIEALVERFLMGAPAPAFPVGQLEPRDELILHVLKE